MHKIQLPSVLTPSANSKSFSRGSGYSAQQVVNANGTYVNATSSVNTTSSINSTTTSATIAGPISVTTQTTCTTGKKGKATCSTSVVTKSTATSTATSTTTSSASSAAATAPYGFINQIQADRVHATSNKGKGIKVALVDSGVDYTRTPLGGGFGPGYKVVGGYDFVGDDYDGSNTPQPDNDPYDGCYGHGTFVAGVLGANPNEYGVTGAAPEASIYAYRVFSCSGAGSDDIIMQAMIRAYNDGVDIINLSLGEDSGWTENALSVLASRLVNAGTVVIGSSGNRGQVGAFFSQAPASGRGVTTAGSFDTAFFPAQQAFLNTNYGPITYYLQNPFTPGTYSVYAFTSLVYSASAGCSVPDGTPDISGKIVVVPRGYCPVLGSAQAVYALGAAGILFSNTANSQPLYENYPINFAFISYDDGNYLTSQSQSNAGLTLTFKYAPIAAPNVLTANITSVFSQIGPTNDMYLSTQLLAPGYHLLGLLPTPLGNWTVEDGSSFSAPLLAGSAALYLKAVGTNVTPKTVMEAFESSASPIATSLSDSTLESVAAQGGGRLAAYDAIYSGVSIGPAEIYLNDTAYFNQYQLLTIKNSGSSRATFKLSNVPAGTALAFASGQNQSNDEPVPQVSNAAQVWFSQTSLTLGAGQTTYVLLSFTPPTGLDAAQFPIYSGFIQVTGGASTVSVPYLGVAAKLKNMPVLDPTSAYLGINTPIIETPSGSAQSGTETYTFQNGDYPVVLWRQVGGTPILLIDLVAADAKLGFTPNYTTKKRDVGVRGENENMDRAFIEARRVQSMTSTSNAGGLGNLYRLYCQLTGYKGAGCSGYSSSTSFRKVPILGNLYEADYIPRK